jgi:hypothetical protein
MTSIKGFNTRRCFLMIKNEIFLGRGNFLIFAAVVWGILLLNLVIIMNGPNLKNGTLFGQNNYVILIFISGLIIFEKSFKELHHENKGAAWLTLPASLFEKYVTRLVYSMVLSVVGIIILFSLFYIISEGVLHILFGSYNTFIHFDLLNKDIFLRTAKCIILMSPFHLGYIYFKKKAFGKTFLSLVAYLLFIFLMAIASLKIFFPDAIHGFLTVNFPPAIIPNLLIENNSLAQAWSIVKWSASLAFWCLFAPFCWVTGYIRLKETEV